MQIISQLCSFKSIVSKVGQLQLDITRFDDVLLPRVPISGTSSNEQPSSTASSAIRNRIVEVEKTIGKLGALIGQLDMVGACLMLSV